MDGGGNAHGRRWLVDSGVLRGTGRRYPGFGIVVFRTMPDLCGIDFRRIYLRDKQGQ